jgi:hypothetical protein
MFEGKHHFTSVYSISPGVTGKIREMIGKPLVNEKPIAGVDHVPGQALPLPDRPPFDKGIPGLNLDGKICRDIRCD